MAGSSGVVAFLAGFCLQRAGFLVFNGFWNKHWVAFYGGNGILASYLYQFGVDVADKGQSLGPATGHGWHFSGMAFGYLLAWYFDRFFR